MTEQEYIDATNLAKIRTMKAILHDCLAMRPIEEEFGKRASATLYDWIWYLESVVNSPLDEEE